MNPSVALVTLLYVSQHALGVEVEVYEGAESVLLPCQVNVTNPQFNGVSWSVKRLSDQIVHQREKSGDKLEDQNQDYANRTSMRTDSLTTGDLSLTLKNPTVRDSETYTCIYRERGDEKSRQEVHLKVKVRPPSPWVIVGPVLAVGLFAAAAVLAGSLYWFIKRGDEKVQQVKVEEGKQSVLLPFKWTDRLWLRMRMCCTRGDLSKDVRVEWTDIGNRKVHVYKDGSDHPEEQDQDYRGRTEMNEDLVKTGDFSLKLKHIRFKDRGGYFCRIYKDGVLLRETIVILTVTVQQVEEVQVDEGAESVQLSFKTTPDPSGDVRVEWTDRGNRKVHVYQNGSVEQELVYRGRTEMKNDLKTGDYSLKLKEPTVTDSGKYTCRVYKKDRDLLGERTVDLKVKEQPVEVEEGAESVLLSFKTTAGLPEDVIVEWTDRNNRKVHVYQNGPKEQDQVYRGRTEMENDLKTGDYSLKLRKPTVTDSGVYYCRVYKDKVLLRERRVTLKVKVQQVEEEAGAESVQLSFKTTAGLPGDVRVEWTDEDDRKVHVYQNGSEEQDQVYRGRTEMKKDLKTGDFSLTLKEPTDRDSGEYSCKVYNKDGDLLRQTRVQLKVAVQQVEEESGAESVLLPFKTTAGLPGVIRVEWRDRENKKVHVYQNGSVEQDQVYRGRTEMKNDLMKTGDYSLKLNHLTVTDSGVHYCRIYNKDGDLLRWTRVELWVTEQPVEVESGAESVLLPFKTTAGLPGDVRVEWRDEDNRKVHVHQNGSEEQDQVYRGRTEMEKDQMKDGDYSLKLKHLTVTDSGRFTCRVYNKDGDLLRETVVELKVKVQQVEVDEGEESVLSFKTTADLSGDVRVEWTDKINMKVHVYQNGSVEQDQVFRGRTELKKDLMKDGDYSLILRHPRDADKGEYCCRVYDKDGVLLRGTKVELKVKGKNKPATEATPLMAEDMV